MTGRQLANVYAQTLGTIFTEQAKPYEVELCVAEVAHYGETKPPELYRITYDGSIADEPHFVVMGGTTEPITTALKDSYAENANLREATRIAVLALRAGSESSNGDQSALDVGSLEVAILMSTGPAGRSAGSTGPRWRICCANSTRTVRTATATRRSSTAAPPTSAPSPAPENAARHRRRKPRPETSSHR